MIPHLGKSCIYLLVLVNVLSRAQHSPPWPQITLNAPVDNFLTDKKNGSLFVAQGQKIFKYSDKFKLIGTSSHADAGKNEILHLMSSNSSQDLLLSCWQTQQLRCTVNRIDSLDQSSDLFPLSKAETFKIDENDDVIILSPQKDAIDILIATNRRAPVEQVETTQTRSNAARSAIARFKISNNPEWSSEQLSVLTYRNQYDGQNLMFNYIYVFNHNQYTYFILNDSFGDQQRVRLARVCHSDTELTSYAEITMACSKTDDMTAKSAYFEATSGPTLYVAFEHKTNAKPTKRSTTICWYDMNLAENYLRNAIQDCNNGASDLSLLAKFETASEQPCNKNPSDDWCSSKLNPYINGTSEKYKLNDESFITIEGMISVNFLYTIIQGKEEKVVFFVGTESGYITKLTSDEYLLYTIDLNESTIRSYHKENKYLSKSATDRTSGATRYASDSQGIVAVSDDHKLNRLDPDTCFYYTSCDSCLNTKDPLDCVWCGESCSRKQDCEKSKRSTKSCPPVIKNFEPKAGPLSGYTSLKIQGNYFGSTKGSRIVRLGNQECTIDNQTSTDSIILCLTPPVNSTQNVSLSVEISGVSGGLDLRGSTTAKETYQYVELADYQDGASSMLIMVVFIMITLVTITYFLRGARFSDLREKIWPAFESKVSDNTHLGASYTSPQPGSGMASNSINELVKLNGSMMSSDNYFVTVDQSPIEQPLMNNFLDNDLLSLLKQEKILIERKLLTLGHVLGSGQFGRVYKGFLLVEETGDHVAVAVKTIHNKSMWDDALEDRAFVEEGLMMKDFEHENVLTLIGVTIDASGLPMVVTPFMLYGDLRSYISDEASSPTVRELIDFGTQVAKGMAYLANLKFVHRDLAARNCMLDENLTVKVADFGLSRDIYERDYYSSENKKTKLPVKWMAIESLERCIYSTKTDVWSYGVLLWELMTRGVVPYPDVDSFDLFSYLKEGRRMMRPRYCPEILYGIMLSCWRENPHERPSFDELVDEVSAVITNLQVGKDGQQTVSRDETYCDAFKRPM